MNDPDLGAPPPRAFDLGSLLEQAGHYTSIERFDLAEDALERAARGYPQVAEVWNEFAYLRIQQGRFEQAEEFARDALSKDPESARAFFLLGNAAMELGRMREAERHYLDALRLEPEHPAFLTGYGAQMLRHGQIEKAGRLIDLALASDPEFEYALSIRTLVLEEQNRTGESREAARRALERSPDGDLAHTLIARRAYLDGRIFRARRHIREALRLEPNDRDTIDLHREIDEHSRWIAIPYYYYSLLLEKLPGRQFAIWLAFLAFVWVSRKAEMPSSVVLTVALSYIGFCLYTWIAMPLTRLWTRVFRAR